jgi:small-conductance mechanosensitive channel
MGIAEVLNLIWSNEIYRKIIYTILLLLGLKIIRRLLYLLISKKMDEDSTYIYTVRKVTSYSLNILATIIIFGMWISRLGDLSVALGIFAAGLAFALQEIIGSFAGWLTIITGKPFSVGDRIEINNIRGDVVDIGILRTTLMEIGNWLQGDHNTGRIVTISNAFVFKEPLSNYSAHLHFIWDEINLPITYDSNWQKAISIMKASAANHPLYLDLLPKAEIQRRKTRRNLAVKITSLEPRVFVHLTDNWIELGMVYPVDNEVRRLFRSDLSKKILEEFENENIAIASNSIKIINFPKEA